MNIIPKIAKEMQTILTVNAENRAAEVELIKRKRQITGSTLAQTLIFGWLDNPDSTLDELTQTAANLGVEITPQGLDKRFTFQTADFIHLILKDTVGTLISTDPVAIPILNRFNGVYIKDSSTVTLPDELGDIWQGCGGRVDRNTKASVKLHVRVNMSTGGMEGPYLYAGRSQDRSCHFQEEHPPCGSLNICDLGYFSLVVMQDMSDHGVFWLSRINTQCSIYHGGDKWDLADFLKGHENQSLDVSILLGAKAQVPCRLLSYPVPASIAAQRRAKLKAAYKREGKTPSEKHLYLTNWTVMVTNVPPKELTHKEAFVMYKIRWQIELIFKLWKSYGSIDKWRTQKPARILCELYAKLVVVVIQHWILLCGCWHVIQRSPVKASMLIRSYAKHLLLSFATGSRKKICEALEIICKHMATKCRMNSRSKKPNAYQLLLGVS